jgi:predicted DNA-binding protein
MSSAIVTLRVSSSLKRSIERAARRRRRTKSEIVREILEHGLRDQQSLASPAEEARRQSLLVSKRASEKEALVFIESAADQAGWR